jgi:hypothetical protein
VFVIVGDSDVAQSMARDGWSRVGEGVGTPLFAADLTAQVDRAPLVHLIGTVEEGTAGCIIEFGSLTPPMRAADVVRHFPQAQLCILQAPPVPRMQTRRDSTRRDANVARWFAHDVHTRGVPAVVVLPPMEAGAAASAVGVIAASISRGFLDARDLMTAARRIRTSILNIPAMTNANRRELANDVCVYCPARWKAQ